jgi:uncharacterized protein YehS (DUF1456 family)
MSSDDKLKSLKLKYIGHMLTDQIRADIQHTLETIYIYIRHENEDGRHNINLCQCYSCMNFRDHGEDEGTFYIPAHITVDHNLRIINIEPDISLPDIFA